MISKTIRWIYLYALKDNFKLHSMRNGDYYEINYIQHNVWWLIDYLGSIKDKE